jgi:biopolymer transport protein ExbB/TolQ
VSDALLRLGLLGTVVGFILMLAPVAQMESFDPIGARTMLQQMSGGMAVALYTTLCGLVTSILLKLQYQILDTSAQDFLNRLAVLTDVHLMRADWGA